MTYTEGKYILKDGEVVEVNDLIEWAEWFESEQGRHDRCIASDYVGDYRVSTVFLGLDYSFAKTKPELFETMVFERKRSEIDIFGKKRMINKSVDKDECFDRYATLEEAKAGHKKIVEVVKKLK